MQPVHPIYRSHIVATGVIDRSTEHLCVIHDPHDFYLNNLFRRCPICAHVSHCHGFSNMMGKPPELTYPIVLPSYTIASSPVTSIPSTATTIVINLRSGPTLLTSWVASLPTKSLFQFIELPSHFAKRQSRDENQRPNAPAFSSRIDINARAPYQR